MVQILSEFRELEVHDAVTPKSLVAPNPELRNVEMPKWAQRRLTPDQTSVHVVASSMTMPFSKNTSCFMNLGFSMQSAPAPCHQDCRNDEPQNAEMSKFHSKGESMALVTSHLVTTPIDL
jgi:hypothetical protein